VFDKEMGSFFLMDDFPYTEKVKWVYIAKSRIGKQFYGFITVCHFISIAFNGYTNQPDIPAEVLGK
jgi:hypothetical protein